MRKNITFNTLKLLLSTIKTKYLLNSRQRIYFKLQLMNKVVNFLAYTTMHLNCNLNLLIVEKNILHTYILRSTVQFIHHIYKKPNYSFTLTSYLTYYYLNKDKMLSKVPTILYKLVFSTYLNKISPIKVLTKCMCYRFTVKNCQA